MLSVLFLERGTRQRLASATIESKHARTQAAKTASVFFIALKLPSVASVEIVARKQPRKQERANTSNKTQPRTADKKRKTAPKKHNVIF